MTVNAGTRRPMVLALDTSTPMLSAAIGDPEVVHERTVAAGRHTGALVPNVVQEVLAAAGCGIDELTLVAVGLGPGPYTSLRAGVMFAEAAAAALHIPVVGACSLDVTARARLLAGADLSPGGFVVSADARRREVYWAHYDHQGRRTAGPQVDPRAEMEAGWSDQDTTVVTSSPPAGALARWVVAEWLAHDAALPTLATVPLTWAAPTDDAAGVQIPQSLLVPRPLYLRRPDAVEPTAAVPAPPGGAS